MQDALCKDAFKSRFLSKIPLFFEYFECDVLVGRTGFELDHTVVGIIGVLKVVLRGFLFVIEIGIEDIEFIPLNGFRRWIILSIVQTIVLIPFTCHSNSIDINGFHLSESSLSFTWYPIIKFLFVFFHSFIFFKFDDLFGDLIVSIGLFRYYFSIEKAMIVG
jgi:hypothetical protein